MRLLLGRESWWCLHASKIAQMPMEAVAIDERNTYRIMDEAKLALERGGFFHAKAPDTYSVTVLTDTGCNLGCSYCFQNVGDDQKPTFAPNRIPNLRLTERVIDGISTFVARRMQEAQLEKVKFLLFGGEPLLSSEACITLLERVQAIGMTSAAMVSNGTLLTPELAARLVQAGLRGIQITFDGDRTTHDEIRVTRNGRGTFDQIVANVAAVSDVVDMQWLFRINVSHHNLRTVTRLLDHLSREVDSTTAAVNIALVDDVGIGYENHLRFDDRLATELVSLYRHALEFGFSVRPPKAGFWCDFCSLEGGARGAVINADGTLYSCWETVGRRDLDVGDVWRGYRPPEDLTPRWHSCNYLSAEHGTPQQAQRFHDQVDAALLDELSARGKLN